MKPSIKPAINDISEGASRWRIAALLGWQDVAQRYRRSKLGAFWLTINMVIMTAAIGIIFGTLFQVDLSKFLPHLAIGIIFWTYISTTIQETANSFVISDGMILQIKLPLSTHVIRASFRNLFILAHNIAIVPPLFILFGVSPSLNMLWSILGTILVALNLVWAGLILAVVCTRFRDIFQVVQNGLQLAFYATPIMWLPDTLPPAKAEVILGLNPFFHLLEIVRGPLLGESVSRISWLVSIFLLPIGWTLAIWVFGRYRARIPYWL